MKRKHRKTPPKTPQLKTLGTARAKFHALELFPCPALLDSVRCTTSEVTALCPVTGQPDFYTVEILYSPTTVCVESKTLKLYLQRFRQGGLFCEAFACRICEDLFRVLNPSFISVKVTQIPRGGIAIEAVAEKTNP